MRLRPLDEIAEPARGAGVHVLEVTAEGRDIACQCGCHRIEAENQRGGDRRQHEEDDRLQRMEQRRARHVHALGAVMDLVEQPPHDREGVSASVPTIQHQRQNGPSERRAADYAETVEVDQAMRVQPGFRDQERRQRRQQSLDGEEQESLHPPPRDWREVSRRKQRLDRKHDQIGHRHQQAKKVDGGHGQFSGFAGQAISAIRILQCKVSIESLDPDDQKSEGKARSPSEGGQEPRREQGRALAAAVAGADRSHGHGPGGPRGA